MLKGVVASWNLPLVANNRQLASPRIHLFIVAGFVEKKSLDDSSNGIPDEPGAIPKSEINNKPNNTSKYPDALSRLFSRGVGK